MEVSNLLQSTWKEAVVAYADTSLNLAGGTEENHEKVKPGQPVIWTRFESSTSQRETYSVTATSTSLLWTLVKTWRGIIVTSFMKLIRDAPCPQLSCDSQSSGLILTARESRRRSAWANSWTASWIRAMLTCVTQFTSLFTNTITNYMGRVLLEKLIVAQWVKKWSISYITLRFISELKRDPLLDSIPNQFNPVLTLKICFLQIILNIILPSMTRSPNHLFLSCFSTRISYPFLSYPILYAVRIQLTW